MMWAKEFDSLVNDEVKYEYFSLHPHSYECWYEAHSPLSCNKIP